MGVGISSHPSGMLMQSSSAQIMASGNVVGAPTASKLHSAEKDPSMRNVGSVSNEFIATAGNTAKYGGGERQIIGPNESNEKQSLSDKLEVTVIPVDEEPYSKMITIP